MANQLPPGTTRATVQGPIEAVPCPHCGKKNDLRDLQSQQLLDTGHYMGCDHCNRLMEVTSIRQVTVISMRQYAGQQSGGGLARQAQQRPVPQQQQPGLMAGVRRLLGGPKR